MRWPVRNQILLPMLCLMLASLTAVSCINAYVSLLRARTQIERDLKRVVATLEQSRFPLTNRVLEQMRGLVGAEFILSDESGVVRAMSRPFPSITTVLARLPVKTEPSMVLDDPVKIQSAPYFHASVRLERMGLEQAPLRLHILYPEYSYRQTWRDVVYPPLAVGAGALVLMLGVSIVIAANVTRPLTRLRAQVESISAGRFESLPVPPRNDELSDLSRSINRMAERLRQYEDQVRRNERLRTLGQLGSGIAHQIRNSVTGCRLAIELHCRNRPLPDEELQVALRQCELMEAYLQRFLSLGRDKQSNAQSLKSPAVEHQPLDLIEVARSAIELISPQARHLGIQFRTEFPNEPVWVLGDARELEQVVVNLTLNALEASSEATATATADAAPWVRVSIVSDSADIRLDVCDSGAGPDKSVRGQLFEPFVTEKPEGTGLGLAIACEIAAAHQGKVSWERGENCTCFRLSLPSQTIAKPKASV